MRTAIEVEQEEEVSLINSTFDWGTTTSGSVPSYFIEHFIQATCDDCGRTFQAKSQDELTRITHEHTLWHIAAPYASRKRHRRRWKNW